MTPEPGREGSVPPPAELPSRIVLVGFMASGKSTVGPILAKRLGYRFVDLDVEVERLAGRSIPEIFRARGEAGFRRLEARVTAGLDGVERVVVAAGGGWMTRSELRDRWPDAVRVWLRVTAETVVARAGDDLASRPLLDREDPVRAARALLAAREERYALAELRVDTDGRDPEAVAREIERLLVRR